MVCCPFDGLAAYYNLLAGLILNPRKYAIAIRKFSNLKVNSRVLDLGGGTGLIGEKIVSHVSSLTILDPSKEMLKQVKGKEIKKTFGYAQKIPFDNHSFDMVYCCDSFHHFVNGVSENEHNRSIDSCIKEMLRVLDKSGEIVIIEFDPNKPLGKVVIFYENKWKKWGSKFYTCSELKKLFESHNCEVEIRDLDSYCYIAKIKRK
jgi:ubiquinone/menaquinone biosynthesis C-methylase UbiE